MLSLPPRNGNLTDTIFDPAVILPWTFDLLRAMPRVESFVRPLPLQTLFPPAGTSPKLGPGSSTLDAVHMSEISGC